MFLLYFSACFVQSFISWFHVEEAAETISQLLVTHNDETEQLNYCSFLFQCTIHPQCTKFQSHIEETVKSYETRYGLVGLPINCYLVIIYNCKNVSIAIDYIYLFQCTFYPQCTKSQPQIEETVKSYQTRYGVVGLPINCYLVIIYNCKNMSITIDYIYLFQCTFYPQCTKSQPQIEETVKSYQTRYGVVGLPINCYFSPSQPHQTIRLKRFHVYHVVNGVLWSSLVFIMTTVLLLYTVRRRGCDFCEP